MNYPIPEPSLKRLQLAYANFEQLATVIAESLGIDVSKNYSVDLPGKRFVVPEDEAPSNTNGLARAVD